MRDKENQAAERRNLLAQGVTGCYKTLFSRLMWNESRPSRAAAGFVSPARERWEGESGKIESAFSRRHRFRNGLVSLGYGQNEPESQRDGTCSHSLGKIGNKLHACSFCDDL